MEENKDNNIQTNETNPVNEVQPTVPVEEAKGKKSKTLMPLVIVLVIIVLGLGGYLAYDKIFAGKNNKQQEPEKSQKEEQQEQQTQDETTKEELDINDETVQKLFNIFRGDKNYYIGQVNSKNYAKLLLAYNIIPNNMRETISCSKLEETVKLEKNLYCGGGPAEEGETYETEYVSSTLMKSKIEELFGSDYSYKPEDFSFDGFGIDPYKACNLMHYNKENDFYAFYGVACGGTTAVPDEEIKSAYKEGNKLYIISKIAEVQSTNLFDNIDQETHIYEFKKDAKNGNYVFVNYTEKKDE